MTIKEQIKEEVEGIKFLPSKKDSLLVGYAERKCDNTVPLYKNINFHPCLDINEAIHKMDALKQKFRQADGFDECLIGIFKKSETEYFLLYDRNKVINQLKNEYMHDTSGLFEDEDDCETSAIEYYEYNIIDSYMEGVPAFATIFTDNEE